jgi:Sec-independent protein secretion pathway component TatC
MLLVPLLGLYEISIWVLRLTEYRERKREARNTA